MSSVRAAHNDIKGVDHRYGMHGLDGWVGLCHICLCQCVNQNSGIEPPKDLGVTNDTRCDKCRCVSDNRHMRSSVQTLSALCNH